MSFFVGIDLGTTNSVISSYDGNEVRVWKSPEQNDVTPSVIYIDKRSKYFGQRAFDNEAFNPNNSAKLFKRLMGTNTPIEFPAVGIKKSPEECSAEILKVLYGYLPEEIRNNSHTNVVITVPAAFNQMQKQATLQAASLAGFGNVALMQEPVAAVMSVMRKNQSDGMFLVYDLGGGTLDVAIAENISGRVSLLAHGGMAMCGGRDFDKTLVKNIVQPWLLENFDLQDDFYHQQQYKPLMRLASWAVEKAKIQLSYNENSLISLSENELNIPDLSGENMYLEIELNRNTYNSLIESQVLDSIKAINDTLNKAGVSSDNLEKVVFIGGPTNYKPLRDLVTSSLGVNGSIELNPMTAVAEGASIFAESIDWNSENRSRKRSTSEITSSGEIDLKFTYLSRTPNDNSRIRISYEDRQLDKLEFEIQSLDSGWSSGRQLLEDGCSLEIPLTKNGENNFRVLVYNSTGSLINIKMDRILIVKTAATIDGIPASHSIGIEVLDRIGGTPVLDYIVKVGDVLPKQISKKFKTTESLKAGDNGFIRFKLWEGDIRHPVSDNRFIGNLKIEGKDFFEGFIPAGAMIECKFNVLDSGNITFKVNIPSIGESFDSDKNFYARQEGQFDYTNCHELAKEESQNLLHRIETIETSVSSHKLSKIKRLVIDNLSELDSNDDVEDSQKSMENIQTVKKLLSEVRLENLKEIRQIDLDNYIVFFNTNCKSLATVSELQQMKDLSNIAQRSIDIEEDDFDTHIGQINQLMYRILWRDDSFICNEFKRFESSSYLFIDGATYRNLIQNGNDLISQQDFYRLRSVINKLYSIKIATSSESMLEKTNILGG
tara:strand:- start:338 stop:2827 length:2490 start_codon:yes stop_codon:yes gene_type:complete